MMLSSSYRERKRSKPNIVLLALIIALHVLVIVLLLLQKAEMLPIKVEQRLTAFLLPDAKEKEDSGDKTTKKAQAKAGAKAAPEDAPKPPVPPPPVPPEVTPVPTTPSFLNMTSAEFAAADISKMASSRKKSGDGGDSQSAYGPGDGPGGVRLYDPDWYRRPTNAQLSGYLPANAPQKGWGLVACRTVENYHVDDCQTLGESPLGSGFGRAVREAAWQFLVLPPRINGRPVIGAWVRIRISYGETDITG